MSNTRWNLANVKEGLDKFKSEFGRYPTATEFEDYPHLPSARQMQRRFGGLIELRQTLGLEGPSDLTRGEHSSKRARDINSRSHAKEKEIYDYLVINFGKPFVHREYLFDENRRVRMDFFIYTKGGGFAVDVFYPQDKHSLTGCLNAKMRTYGHDLDITHPVIFLVLNENIENDILGELSGNKRNKLLAYQKLMSLKEFRSFCASESRLYTAA